MTIIGITGGTGSGKTSALRALSRLGAKIIDCDALYHELLESNSEMLSELEIRFGGAFSDGALDRKALGKIVFDDASALTDLNAITHKYVRLSVSGLLTQWAGQGEKLAAIDAIALIESGISDYCDILVAVCAPKNVRIERIMARDGVSRKYAEMRIDSQQQDSFYTEQCDYVLTSSFDTPEEFEDMCAVFFKKILGGDADGE